MNIIKQHAITLKRLYGNFIKVINKNYKLVQKIFHQTTNTSGIMY